MATSPEQILWLLIIAVLLAGMSIALAYMARWYAVIAAFVALLCAKVSGGVILQPASLWFWGAATAIAVGINVLLPERVRNARTGIPYMVTGALTGAFLGMLLNSVAGIITASALGALLGAVAYSRTPNGKNLQFPSRKFFNYICAKGLPLVVTLSMLGILCLHLIVIGANK